MALEPVHAWLAARGCELADGGALAAGEHSTVGALLAGAAAAALSPLVQAATYVNHHGQASAPVAYGACVSRMHTGGPAWPHARPARG